MGRIPAAAGRPAVGLGGALLLLRLQALFRRALPGVAGGRGERGRLGGVPRGQDPTESDVPAQASRGGPEGVAPCPRQRRRWAQLLEAWVCRLNLRELRLPESSLAAPSQAIPGRTRLRCCGCGCGSSSSREGTCRGRHRLPWAVGRGRRLLSAIGGTEDAGSVQDPFCGCWSSR